MSICLSFMHLSNFSFYDQFGIKYQRLSKETNNNKFFFFGPTLNARSYTNCVGHLRRKQKVFVITSLGMRVNPSLLLVFNLSKGCLGYFPKKKIIKPRQCLDILRIKSLLFLGKAG